MCYATLHANLNIEGMHMQKLGRAGAQVPAPLRPGGGGGGKSPTAEMGIVKSHALLPKILFVLSHTRFWRCLCLLKTIP